MFFQNIEDIYIYIYCFWYTKEKNISTTNLNKLLRYILFTEIHLSAHWTRTYSIQNKKSNSLEKYQYFLNCILIDYRELLENPVK